MFWIELFYLGVSQQDQYKVCDALLFILILKVHLADFKISLYIVTHINIIPWKFRILDCKNSPGIHP